MTANEEGMMAQIWIAFGQGAGAIKVSSEAALELRRWYFDAITPRITNEGWEAQAAYVLARMRAIGRLAASKAASIGGRRRLCRGKSMNQPQRCWRGNGPTWPSRPSFPTSPWPARQTSIAMSV